jgi:predicted RNA-binding Zn-ribbon protein involved in translation (DUF1610 family)
MLGSPVEFFRSLPPKICTDCGKEIEEQHEAYHNKCDNCIDTEY